MHVSSQKEVTSQWRHDDYYDVNDNNGDKHSDFTTNLTFCRRLQFPDKLLLLDFLLLYEEICDMHQHRYLDW